MNFLSLIVAKSADWYAQWVQLMTWLQALYDGFLGNATMSASSRTPGSGSFQFDTVPASRIYAVDTVLKAASRGTPTTYIQGIVTAGAAGSVTLNAQAWNGSTASDWDIAPVIALSRSPRRVVAKTANYTVTAADRDALIDATANGPTITLPSAAAVDAGTCFGVRNSQASGRVPISGTVDGIANPTLGVNETWELISDGSAWKTTAKANAITLADLHAAALSFT